MTKDTFGINRLTKEGRQDKQDECMRSFRDFLKNAKGYGDYKILHVSMPFCDSICNFCGALRFKRSGQEQERYLRALMQECEMYSDENYIQSSYFAALYLHGGTPTVMSAQSLKYFIEFCRDSFNFIRDPEMTIESTVHNIDRHKMDLLINSGVTRLYLGVQAFDEAIRRRLNRISSGDEAFSAIRTAHDVGFDVRIDLMYRLPGQTMAHWESDLMRAVELGVENISIFRLHLYPNIRLNRMVESGEVPPLPGNDEAGDMQERAVALLEGAGYRRQYPSGFSLPGKESRYHELYYKHQGEGLGLGVTEWFYSLLGNYNYINTDSLERYIQMIDDGLMPVDRIYAFSKEEMMKRYVLRSIRSGIDVRSFIEKFGIPLDEAFGKQISRLKEAGWICEEGGEIKLTSSAQDGDGVGRCMDILTDAV